MTTQTIDPTILDRLTTCAANLREIVDLFQDPNALAQLDNLDQIVTDLTPPPPPETPGKPDWMAEGCCGGTVTPEVHGPGIETWPDSPDQFWCTGWDPDAQTAEPARAE
jgi:hypothetical protein